MENFTQGISRVLPTAGHDKRLQDGHHERPTHRSLPKLLIPVYRGPAPKEIPPSQVKFFTNIMAARSPQAPGSLLPLPVLLPSSAGKSCPLTTDVEHDPYLEDVETPLTLQFNRIDALELSQWKELTRSLRESHADALDQLHDNPRDSKLREKVRAFRAERENNLNAISQAYDRRHIRKNFRKDFNNIVPGW
ncbi:hypothetical protein F5B17DRAFT_436737 [Nemania serpens]|nr:hypothetical protein F5B17DRAFT_436737 [Nemania serpens]